MMYSEKDRKMEI